MRIEAQGKYLQSVLEKAHATLEIQNLNSTGHEVAKVQLPELASKVSNEYFNNGFPSLGETHGVDNLQEHSAQLADCSIDSCLTSCEGSQKDQEKHNINMKLRVYHCNAASNTREKQEDDRFEQTNPKWWCGEFNGHTRFSLPRVSRGPNIFPMNFTYQGETVEGRSFSKTNYRETNNYNSEFEQLSYRRDSVQQESSKNSNEFTKLDLNARDDNNATQTCKEFDLNGFSWS